MSWYTYLFTLRRRTPEELENKNRYAIIERLQFLSQLKRVGQ